jgi:hypothetical protein
MTDTPHEDGEILKANQAGPSQIEVGMEVVSLDGEPIGRVKEVRKDDFLVDRPMARDVYVPFGFVLAEEAGEEPLRGGPTEPLNVILTVTGAEINSQNWRHP